MNSPERAVGSALTPRQLIMRRKMNDELDKFLRLQPTTPHSRYARKIAVDRDWMIREQPLRQLPYSLTQLLTMDQRDRGNALIEETRLLNNRYKECSFRDIEAMLSGDEDCLDLSELVMEWAEEVSHQVIFKLRNKSKDDPYKTFKGAYRSFVSEIDNDIVHGTDRMYQLVWSAVVDMLPFKLADAMLFKPGHCTLVHDETAAHVPNLSVSERSTKSVETEAMAQLINLYGVETMLYTENVILRPLLAELRLSSASTFWDEQSAQCTSMFADLLEASAYLVSSDRVERYMFPIPGTTCVASFSFVPNDGCAKFMFWDDVESMKRGIPTNFCRGALMIDRKGRMSFYMHPWRTLEAVFGANDGLRLACWLLSQVHGRVVEDYLKIERYFLDAPNAQADGEVLPEGYDETLIYVAWAKASEPDNAVILNASVPPDEEDNQRHGVVPQLRRRHFFKLLGRCGVSIEQGKGSELKLLRHAKHPFRLGNHYGSNPTIPAFLAISVLKRLEITRDEWFDALALG